MSVKVRPRLTTEQAEAMGVEEARAYHAKREKELKEAEKEAVLEREKGDFVQRLIDRGLPKDIAEKSWQSVVIEETLAEAEQLRQSQRDRMAKIL